MSSAMSEQCECAGLGCYVYTVGIRRRDGDMIGEELHSRGTQAEAALVARRRQDQGEVQVTL